MSEWQKIESAPKDRHVLLYGAIDKKHPFELISWGKNRVFSGYWDSLDESWVPDGSTWQGPFMEVTHWMPLPSPPQDDK